MRIVSFALFFCYLSVTLYAKDFQVSSPNAKIKVVVSDNDGIGFKASFNSKPMLSVSGIMLEIREFQTTNYKIKSVEQKSVNEIIIPEFHTRTDKIPDRYNSLTFDFGNNIKLIFRVYDNGVAYRFKTAFDGNIIISDEKLNIKFTEQDSVWCQSSKSFNSSYETPYMKYDAGKMPENELFNLPWLIMKKGAERIIISESSLTDYPGLWFKFDYELLNPVAVFPKFPVKFKTDGSPYHVGSVTETADYICQTEGKREFPWRIFAFAENDKDIIHNQLVYILSEKNVIKDVSWIKPGKVIFDWWARNNIYSVDFKAGINTATTKYFIDFCSKYGFEYFLFDDGWADNSNILNYSKDLNMEEIAAYAKQKNVGLMAWLMWSTFDKQMTEVFDMLEKWGFKGIKVDFMNRDDQIMVNFYEKVAIEAAKRKMVIDFHGAFKPSGLHRKYPNVLTCEGLIEFEYNGWTNDDNPDHHNLLPYIRMFAGPMDYIPGTINNATKNNFRHNGEFPMGQGTRAHAIALAVILESPMMMLPDSPSDYYREEETTRFIAKIPVEWDETKVLDAHIGDYTIIARRNGTEWYLGAITDWKSRNFEIKFDFLGDGEYQIKYFEDGLNAGKRATDYNLKTETISKSTVKRISLASGGGWVARISKK